MHWVASGFLFVRGNTAIHRLDPRARLLLAIGLFSVAIASHSFIELAILITFLLIVTAWARIFKRFAKSMIFTFAISAIAFVVYYFVYSPWYALIFSMRLFGVIASTSTFFLTSTPDELEHVMRWLRLPPDFVMVFVIAVRFIPVLMLDAVQIMDAQRSRGLELDKGNLARRIRNSIPVLVPLIAVALNRSLDLAEAMDSRAYGVGKPTSLYTLHMRTSDRVLSVAIVVVVALGLYVALFGSLL